MKKVIHASSKSYEYKQYRIYDNGTGYQIYNGKEKLGPEFETADDAEQFVDEECGSDTVQAATLTGRNFRKFLRSKEAPRSLKSVAGDLLAKWYNREGASIKDITYTDIGEMANAADDDLDRATVFYAMGYWNSEDFKEALEGMGYDEDEIASIMR